jgi:hypothetical protein
VVELTSERVTFDEGDMLEEFHARGWTDGLPVVAPTPERVEAMLEHAGLVPETVIGTMEDRDRELTAEKAAINAVMAGCLPIHFPVVVAGLSAMMDDAFNAHTVMTSTGGAALCLVVSGPVVDEIGIQARHNVLGPGNRANASIGRTLRLVARNVFGARTGEMDASSFGNPGKYTMCIGENQPYGDWDRLRDEFGYGPDESCVMIMGTEGPHQIANLTQGDPEALCRMYAASMNTPSTLCVGRRAQVIVLLGPEHGGALAEAGWSRQRVRETIAHHARIAPEQLEAAGIKYDTDSGIPMVPDDDGLLPRVASPDDIFLVTAGGEGAGWSAYIPAWAPPNNSAATHRRVMPPGQGLAVIG